MATHEDSLTTDFLAKFQSPTKQIKRVVPH